MKMPNLRKYCQKRIKVTVPPGFLVIPASRLPNQAEGIGVTTSKYKKHEIRPDEFGVETQSVPSGLVVMETQFIFPKKNMSKVENLSPQLIRRVRF